MSDTHTTVQEPSLADDAAGGREDCLLDWGRQGLVRPLIYSGCAFQPTLREEDTLKASGQFVDSLGITNETSGLELLQQTVT